VRGLNAHQADGYSSNVTAFWSDGRPDMLISKADPQRCWDHFFESAGPGCTYVLRTNMAIALQDCLRARPAEAARVYSHDWLIYAYARANGYRWHIDPTPRFGIASMRSMRTA
jgi:rhamnosyltransferase